MTKKAKTFKTGIGLEPLSADPASPKEGQLQVSDGTHREAGLWLYENGAWKEASVDSFLDFPDTPSDYTGNANKFAKVNLAEDALEFTDVTSNYDYGTYAPTASGFGTITGASATFAQIGNMLHIQGKITSGTPTAVEAQIDLPSGYTIKTGQTVRVIGHATVTGISSPYTAMLNVLATGDDAFLNLSFSDGTVGGDPLTPATGDFIADSAVDISFTAFIEVNEALASNLSGGFVNNFLSITDTPIDYTGQAGKAVVVKDTEDGLEFGSSGTFSGTFDVGSTWIGHQQFVSGIDGGNMLTGGQLRILSEIYSSHTDEGVPRAIAWDGAGSKVTLEPGYLYQVEIWATGYRCLEHQVVAHRDATVSLNGQGSNAYGTVAWAEDSASARNTISIANFTAQSLASGDGFQIKTWASSERLLDGQGLSTPFGGHLNIYTFCKVTVVSKLP